MKGKATIQMVAERAGVSRGTVDRVLNGRPHVNEEARRKVLEAAEALGYVPLSQRRQEEGPAGLTLGILLPNWEGQFRAEVAALRDRRGSGGAGTSGGAVGGGGGGLRGLRCGRSVGISLGICPGRGRHPLCDLQLRPAGERTAEFCGPGRAESGPGGGGTDV